MYNRPNRLETKNDKLNWLVESIFVSLWAENIQVKNKWGGKTEVYSKTITREGKLQKEVTIVDHYEKI